MNQQNKIEIPCIDTTPSIFKTIYTSFDPPVQATLTSEIDDDVISNQLKDDPEYIKMYEEVL